MNNYIYLLYKYYNHKPFFPYSKFSQVFVYLGLFEFLVVISFQLNERTKDVLVLIGVFISQQDVLRLLIHTRLFQVLQGRSGIFLPEQNTHEIKD